MQRSDQINEFAAAFAKAQGQLVDATKDSTNPHFRSKYADFASVREAVRLPLSGNGLSYLQGVRTVAGGVEIETLIMHTSGQFVSETLMIPVAQMSAQTIGSAITYGKRYSLMGMVGIAASEDDDDGNKASERPQNHRDDMVIVPERAAKEPAVTSKAIAMGREIKALTSLNDLEAFKRTDEFKAFWIAAHQADRNHVIAAVEQRKAQYASDLIGA